MAHETDTSITGLVRGVMDDARELIREEIALAKSEARLELSKAGAAAAQVGAAAVAGWFAMMFLLGAVALGISAALDWPAWAGVGIVAVVLGIAALVLSVGARAAVRRVQPLPRTVDSLKENFR